MNFHGVIHQSYRILAVLADVSDAWHIVSSITSHRNLRRDTRTSDRQCGLPNFARANIACGREFITLLLHDRNEFSWVLHWNHRLWAFVCMYITSSVNLPCRTWRRSNLLDRNSLPGRKTAMVVSFSNCVALNPYPMQLSHRTRCFGLGTHVNNF